jgi:hypothetical protein
MGLLKRREAGSLMMLRYVPFIMRQDQPPRRLPLHEGLMIALFLPAPVSWKSSGAQVFSFANSCLSSALPALLAAALVRKKTGECFIGIDLPAR